MWSISHDSLCILCCAGRSRRCCTGSGSVTTFTNPIFGTGSKLAPSHWRFCPVAWNHGSRLIGLIKVMIPLPATRECVWPGTQVAGTLQARLCRPRLLCRFRHLIVWPGMRLPDNYGCYSYYFCCCCCYYYCCKPQTSVLLVRS